jgi:hypothetical protein
MPAPKGPNTKAVNKDQVELVRGDIDRPESFVEDLNRKLAQGYTPLDVVSAHYHLYGFVVKKKRVTFS